MKPLSTSILFSGIKPSGDLHIGNYIGAITQWLKLQDQYQCIFSVVDYHAITVKQEPSELRRAILNIARVYLAAGINPKKTIIFQQSDISEHTELGWILNTITKVSELEKMTQYKDKASNQKKEGPSAGLLNYPTLMAADILLYQADVVPVGDDQTQHIEMTRNLGRRFNQEYGETFTIPKPLIKEQGARIMSLDDPTKKMSKSSKSPASYISLTDNPTDAHKKIKRAVTDSESAIIFNEEKKPAISNLLTIYSNLENISIRELEIRYEHTSYGEFKEDLANIVAQFLENFQERYNAFNDDEIKKIFHDGAVRAKPLAEKTMKVVKHNLGIS
ncbi:MAG TPA: tryptophan--tRNA ligase [bacterium]|nr:tryptophan--tRNA ligase [bacterium]